MSGSWRFGPHSSSENEVLINFRKEGLQNQDGHRLPILHKEAPMTAGVLTDTIMDTLCSLHVQILKKF
jgi:hypothetical protein